MIDFKPQIYFSKDLNNLKKAFSLLDVSMFILVIVSCGNGTYETKHPEWHNYPKRMNEENVEQFYLLSRKILNQTKNLCLIIFSVIIVARLLSQCERGWVKREVSSIYRHTSSCYQL